VNRDFIERLSTFTAHTVEYIVVGAHALAAHGYGRATRMHRRFSPPWWNSALHSMILQCGTWQRRAPSLKSESPLSG